MTESPTDRPDGEARPPVTPDPPYPPGSDVAEVVDAMSDAVMPGSGGADPPLEEDTATHGDDDRQEPPD